MKRISISFFLILLLIVGCREQQTAAPESSAASVQPAAAVTTEEEAAEPTEVPPTAAVIEPTEAPAADAESGSDEAAMALPDSVVAQLDAFLQSQVWREGGRPEGAAPGLILLVDTPEGTYLNAAGVSSLEDGAPMQADDHLEIGSNTKSFIIVILLQMQEEGLLSFDDQLSDWLPELAEQIPNGDQITLRQLATHTSGIWDYGDPIIGEAVNNPDMLEQGFTPEELVQYAIDNGTPDFNPGQGVKYSNTGYILLGLVAEAASSQSLGDLQQERIFDPLGLESAVFLEGVPEDSQITTQGYWWLEDDTLLNTTNWNASQGWAAGSNAMTAADLATFGKALGAGELFQDPDSLDQMLAFNEAAVSSIGAPYSLGLIDFGHGYWGHEGQTAGFQSLWFTNPDERITVVGLTNSAAYSGFNLLNVINILDGHGLQPFQSVTLLPIADQAPILYTSNWELRKGQEGSDVTAIPPGFILSLGRDNSAIFSGPACGPVDGTFSAGAQAQITLEFDLSAVTCAEGDPTRQLVDALQSGGSWRFENGGLVITMAEDGSELTFLPAPPPEESAVSDSCPLFDLPFPRPEPDYSGKVVRDFSPFADALAAYTAEDAAARAELVSGKTVPELQGLMESGDLTSVDLVVYYLERIQRYDVDGLNSVLELNPEALQIAQALDDERAAGTVHGYMHGIPVLLKDNIATGDQLHTAAGAAAMLDWDPARDSFLAGQLRQAGAVILGKANLSEWANYMDDCMPNGFSTNGGQTQNPYGPFETYGSSSGSAVAVAADLTAVSVGTETQGSIILPAGINSVVALKPTKGMISTDYVIPLLPMQDVPGPIGRTVTDVAVLLSAVTGTDANDFRTSATTDLAGYDFTQILTEENWQTVRVGLPLWNDEAFEAYFAENNVTDEEQQTALRAVLEEQNEPARVAGDILSAAGIKVVEIPKTAVPVFGADLAPLLEYGFQRAINKFLSDLGDEAPRASLAEIIAFNNEDPANRAPYGQSYLEASNNTTITEAEFADKAQLANGSARNALDIFFENYDIDVVVSSVAQLYATAGYPALTVPAGYAEDGTPQGTVFVGRFLSEPQLLAVGYAYEQGAQARVAPDLEATMALIEAIEE